jgi:7-cyano-7-deazaguanine synthase
MAYAVVLLSGGLDSTVSLAKSIDEGFDCIGLFFQYGQRHIVEYEAAKRIASHYSIPLQTISIPLPTSSSSPLVKASASLPERSLEEITTPGNLPPAYVPARNTLFLAHALAFAEVEKCDQVIVSVNAHDENFPDCSKRYIQAMKTLYEVATNYPVSLQAPLLKLTKPEIVSLGYKLHVPLHKTHSCYTPAEANKHCGTCDACKLRKLGFAEANIADNTPYA